MLGITDGTSRSQYARARALLNKLASKISVDIKKKIMPANEFEKNVQKTMDELKLHPSAEVWQKLKERIQEKKKKRRVFFLILFFIYWLVSRGLWDIDFSNRRDNSISKSFELQNKKAQSTGNKEHKVNNSSLQLITQKNYRIPRR